jgi:type IV pilus assembly protein PilN
MYSLDVNFLKDRHLTEGGKAASSPKMARGIDLRKQAPLFIGLGVGAALLGLTGLLGLLVNWQMTETQTQLQALDAELGQLKSQSQKLEEMRGKLGAIDKENQALVGVFNQIRPWSAVFQEIRQQTPPTVLVQSIQQTDLPADPAIGEPLPRTQLKITGFANNYESVNHYLLTLQDSPFLKAKKTSIETAALADLPLQLVNDNENISVSFPKVVQYSIITELNDKPASQQLPNLARNGAVGVVTRLKTLERQGALQP